MKSKKEKRICAVTSSSVLPSSLIYTLLESWTARSRIHGEDSRGQFCAGIMLWLWSCDLLRLLSTFHTLRVQPARQTSSPDKSLQSSCHSVSCFSLM
ncbi:hypothetical protein Mp_8g04830 [Marchantia polymorpha subsp. ruderalis]|uniref:Uncharacterized protein n=1 Tax=Marchantia polymorpha TaxID=3197 RepID=A0A2R6VZW2_MARPO|nr:hypothetical protein MARPO_0217s0008 [Marchantia polymorpha]BBN18712.1 hypothetical protein Mp_8g04830 [Marchantia polymorpha subsp. ruderalis]|eukprot:PTQ27148.1 hypothetical protein MARPO_0217s0008 [Marchantia polymorpha]